MAEKKAALRGIVLAEGEGSRLKRFIQESSGTDAPKQFCAFVGRRTMIEQTLRRAETIIPRKRRVHKWLYWPPVDTWYGLGAQYTQGKTVPHIRCPQNPLKPF
jgi:hypothetical protein